MKNKPKWDFPTQATRTPCSFCNAKDKGISAKQDKSKRVCRRCIRALLCVARDPKLAGLIEYTGSDE